MSTAMKGRRPGVAARLCTILLLWLAVLLHAGGHAAAHPDLEGIWVNEEGLELQFLQSDDDCIAYLLGHDVEVFRATLSRRHSSVGYHGWQLDGGIYGALEDRRVAGGCTDWSNAWIDGYWRIAEDGQSMEGFVRPIHVSFNSATLVCDRRALPPQRSRFTKRVANETSCVSPDTYPAWQKAIRPVVMDYYDAHYFDTREPGNPLGPPDGHVANNPVYEFPFNTFVTGTLLGYIYEHEYFVGDSVQIVPIGTPQFPLDSYEVVEDDLNHAEWALSSVEVGPVWGLPGDVHAEQQLWFRRPGEKWQRYAPCKALACAHEAAFGNELIATIGTAGLSVGWNATRRAITWSAQRYVGARAMTESGKPLVRLVAEEFMDDLVRVAACERGSIHIPIRKPPIVELVDDLPSRSIAPTSRSARPLVP